MFDIRCDHDNVLSIVILVAVSLFQGTIMGGRMNSFQ